MSTEISITIATENGISDASFLTWDQIRKAETDGFLMLPNGSVVEVRAVHRTSSGVQIELM